MAYFATTTAGGTARYYDETMLNDLKNSLGSMVEPAGSDHDMDKTREYIPSTNELLQRHDIELKFLSIGCVIRIGCKTIPFESVENAMAELNNYVNNPYATEKKWRKILDK